MAKVIKDIYTSWDWEGDTYLLRGFNVAITPADANPKTDLTTMTSTSAVKTDIRNQGTTQYEHIFRDITLDDTKDYKVWVQALIEGDDSEWVNANGVTVSDDGTATIETPIGSQNKADNAESNAKSYTDDEINTLNDNLSTDINNLESNVNDFSSDSKITLAESNSLEKSLSELKSESNDLTTVASNLGISTTNYDNAISDLDTYLTNNWINQSGYPLDITSTDRTTIKNKFDTVQDEKSKLINAISEQRELNAKDYAEPEVHKGTTSPSDTSKLWLDTSVTPELWKHYDGSSWIKATPENSDIDALQTTNAPAEAGADTTGNHHAKDQHDFDNLAGSAGGGSIVLDDAGIRHTSGSFDIQADGDAYFSGVVTADGAVKTDSIGENVNVSGTDSMAIGNEASSHGNNEVVIGRLAKTEENESVAIGYGAKALSYKATAIGAEAWGRDEGDDSNATSQTAIGAYSDAYDESIAVGAHAYTEKKCVAVGKEALGAAYDDIYEAVAIGYNSFANNRGIAIGGNATAEYQDSIKIGYGEGAYSDYKIYMGVYDETNHELYCAGDIVAGGQKSFEIDHPHPDKKDTHVLRHGAYEGNVAGGTIYRYRDIKVEDNYAEIELPDYFGWLNANDKIDVMVNPQGHFGSCYGEVLLDDKKNAVLRVYGEKQGKYTAIVFGTRDDENVQKWKITEGVKEKGENWWKETKPLPTKEIDRVQEINREREV